MEDNDWENHSYLLFLDRDLSIDTMGIKVQHPRCFFDIATNNQPAGRVVFELFSGMLPQNMQELSLSLYRWKGDWEINSEAIIL